MSVSQVTAKSRLQGTGHAEFDAWVHDQHLLIELIKPHGCEPLELTQEMQSNRLLGTTGAIFQTGPQSLPSRLLPQNNALWKRLRISSASM